MLGLFYSLAFHMYQSLGKWPTSIGERGFPPLLLTHARIANIYLVVFLLVSVLVLPLAILVCSVVPRWRQWVPYLGVYVLSVFVCWALTQLAPEPFLWWWRD